MTIHPAGKASAEEPVGVLVMAYGTASGPDDIERYYTDIRGGRPPSPEHLEELRERYRVIGNRFPLLDITRGQAEALEVALNSGSDGPAAFRTYLGMKHSPPFIAEGVERMRKDGIRRAVGLVMAPHWSGMSVETYVERVQAAVGEDGPEVTFVRHWYDHPDFVRFLAERVAEARDGLPPDRHPTAAIFSAHSLPVRITPAGATLCKLCEECQERCRYVDQLRHTAELVSSQSGIEQFRIAWQSAGRTPDPWWGPSVEDVIRELAGEGHRSVVVCSAGFVADHLEVLYDLDVEAAEAAREVGIRLARTEMPNTDPRFIAALASVVRDHLR